MVERCEQCDRPDCPTLSLADRRRPPKFCPRTVWDEAKANCLAHRVNWRTRAKKAEAIIAAATERATALSRAGLGTMEPWAQAGRVLREIAGQMLECLRGEDVPAVVLIPADDWVPVTERLPPMGQEVDLWDGFGRLPDYHRDGDADLWEWFNVHGEPIGDVPGAGDPTHWRPMPAPPVVSKTERSEDA